MTQWLPQLKNSNAAASLIPISDLYSLSTRYGHLLTLYIYIYFFLIILFVYLFGLHWVFVAVVGLSSSCGVQEVLLAVVRGPLVDVTSLGQHGLYCSQLH